jgi:hypothetical protein
MFIILMIWNGWFMSSEKQSSCHECNYDEGTNLLKYDQSIYYLCDDCYEEHMKEEE